MARSFAVAARLYQPGSITRTIDALPVGVSKIRVTFTRENWPGTPDETVAVVTVWWDDGSGAVASLPGGVVLGKDGQPAAVSSIEIDVPEEADGQGGARKRAVQHGTVTLDIFQPLRTAISGEAL